MVNEIKFCILHKIYLISSIDKDEILLIFIQSSRQYCCSMRVPSRPEIADKCSVVIAYVINSLQYIFTKQDKIIIYMKHLM